MLPTKAKVTGTALVAAFRTSNPPTVWRMDLDKNHSFAIAIQGREGDWELGIMSPRGEFTVVARFGTREEVDGAFNAVQRAMLAPSCPGGHKWLRCTAFITAIVAILLIGVLLLSAVPVNGSGSQTVHAPLQQGQVAIPAPTPSGIPLPADEVLKGQ